MTATKQLHDLGQSLWLDNITRDLLNNGTLQRYIDELSVTGLTSNPTIFDQAIGNSSAYNDSIEASLSRKLGTEQIFFELALDDLKRAADQFRPIFDRTKGVDGWVSLEVSPLLAFDTANTIKAAKDLSARANRPNLFIKIPGTKEGLPAIEESIFSGVPVNVTLLFSADQYVAAAEAYLSGIERRIEAGLDPQVGSVASVFISRWDAAVVGKAPEDLNNKLGIAVGKEIYKAYIELSNSARWQRAYNFGAVSSGSSGQYRHEGPKAPDTLYIEALAAPFTVNTMPEKTLKAFAEHGHVGGVLSTDGGDGAVTLAKFAQAGVDLKALANTLQNEGAKSFVKSWNELISVIESKSSKLAATV